MDWLSAKLGVEGCGPYAVDNLAKAGVLANPSTDDACDLEAQESVANSTRWLLVIAGFQTMLGGFGTYLVWRSLTLNREATNAAASASAAAVAANDLTQKHFAAAQRPWLRFVGEPVVSHFYEDNGHHAIFAKVLLNKGARLRSTSRHMFNLTRFRCSLGRPTKPPASSGDCVEKRKSDVGAVVVFPEDGEVETTSVTGLSHENSGGGVRAQMILCVTYRAADFPEIYYTAVDIRFSYDPNVVPLGALNTDTCVSSVMDDSFAMI